MPDLAELRVYDEKGWRWNHHSRYCPLCMCNKSGRVEEPNGHCPPCSDDNCPCHDEDA